MVILLWTPAEPTARRGGGQQEAGTNGARATHRSYHALGHPNKERGSRSRLGTAGQSRKGSTFFKVDQRVMVLTLRSGRGIFGLDMMIVRFLGQACPGFCNPRGPS
jgi:hypothetical protein